MTPCQCHKSDEIAAMRAALDSVSEDHGALRTEFEAHRDRSDTDVSTIHQDLSAVRRDVALVREDLHKMLSSLNKIAAALEKLSDFPETWVKLKGFWAVARWLRDNWFLIAVLSGVFMFATVKTLESFLK